MKSKRTSLHPLLATLLIALLLHACNWPSDSGGDQTRPPQTKILNVRVQPDTVAPGDTARFTCIIKDSTNSKFTFDWFDIDSGEMLDGEKIIDNPITYRTDKNTTRWIAPDSVGHLLSFTVTVNNGSEDSSAVDASFTIFIAEN